MPSEMDQRLDRIFNRLPEIDPVLKVLVRTNSKLSSLMSMDFEKIPNPKLVTELYEETISIFSSNDYLDEWIIDILREYLKGETWEKWRNVQKIIKKIKGNMDILQQKENEEREEEKEIREGKKAPSEFSFSVNEFKINESGIYKTVKRKGINGDFEDDIQLTPTPCFISAMGENIDTGKITYNLHVKNIMGKEIDLWKTSGELLKKSEVLKLQDEVHFQECVAKEIMNYFDEYILKYRFSLPREITVSSNGWKNDYTLFVIGEKAIERDRIVEVTQVSDEMNEKYVIKGDKEEWIENLKEIMGNDLVRLKMYATVGAFLIRFTPVETFLIHNYEESSGGKTLSMKIAASLIGNPGKDGVIESAANSQVGFEFYLESHTDTPVFWDDTSANPEFIKNVYLLGNEKGRGRGTKDLRYKNGGNWRTIAQSTGEEPLTHGISEKTGNQARVIEVHERLPKYEKEDLERIDITLKNNYGFFLEDIIKEVFKVKDNIEEYYKQISKQLGTPSNEFVGRKKGYFVVLGIAGSIVEKILMRSGIDPKNNIDICKKYYEKVVQEDPTIPYSERALQSVYQWTVRNLTRFEKSKKEFGYDGLVKGPYETYGWITKDAIYYDEGVLTKILESMGFNYQRVKEDWKKEIIEPYTLKDKETGKVKIKSYLCATTINGKRIKGLKIKVKTLMDKLEMDGPIFEELCNTMEKDPDEMDLKEKCDTFLRENPTYSSVVYTDEQAAEGLIREYNQIELLYGGKDYIVQMMRLCRQGCRSN